jgi:hypothetical protein
MVIKLKVGCLVNLQDIKIAQYYSICEGNHQIEISYYDYKKNPNSYISCESREESNQLIDKLLEEIKNSKKIKMSVLA